MGVVSEIEEMSHVELLNAYTTAILDEDSNGEYAKELDAEILRRMDSACTSRREEIRP